MSKTYDLTESFLSYATKPDKSNTDRRFLVKGSINTIINDAEKVSSRGGYTLFGAEGETGEPIEGSYDWSTSGIGGDEPELDLHLSSADDVLECYIGTIGDRTFDSWETLKDSFTSVKFVFDSYWDNTEKIDRTIFCNGSSNLYDWSGALATFASATTNTITIEGSLTAGQRRFLTSGTRQLRIKDDSGTWRTFTYTGGESTTTLTGVTSDPTAFTISPGALIMQEVIVRSNIPATNYKADFLRVINNQVHVGSRTSRIIYVSQNDNVADYTFSTPRIAGEGALFTLDQAGRAIRVLKENPVYFTKDYRYAAEFKEITVSTTLTEAATCKRLKTAYGQGAKHHELSAETENGIAYISDTNELLILQDAAQADRPLVENLSDLIKPDFDDADFTNGHLFPHKNRIYISVPTSGLNFIHETRQGVDDQGNQTIKKFWQPPQTFPVRRWADINGSIHGHSSIAAETYTLFSGLNDNGAPILCRAHLARYNGGNRSRLKYMDEIFNEGDISTNTLLSVQYLIEKEGGDMDAIDREINGADEDITYQSTADPSLGNDPIGEESLSGNDEEEELPKFRVYHELSPSAFFDYETRFESNNTDQEWAIRATGPNATLSTAHATANKQ